jgi:histidinol dehydrogenase
LKFIEGFNKAKVLLSREVVAGSFAVSPSLKQSLKKLFGTEDPESVVKLIIAEVKKRGDAAIFDLALIIDGIKLGSLEVDKKNIDSAYQQVDREVISALKFAAERVEAFHQSQRESIWHEVSGGGLSQLIRPLKRVGIYVPGGTASYPSTVLMTAIPARVAGVEEVIMVTPPRKDGEVPPITLVAADIAGVDRIFKVGGAQAIAALACCTESIPRVDKICGPGNIFVMLAKKLVFGSVDIDGLQGPSEVLVIADKTAEPRFCAAEILAQAEHDALASAILVTDSRSLADAIKNELGKQLKNLSRQSMLNEALNNAIVALVSNMDEAVELSNLYAPEHLCIIAEQAESYVSGITNAGCVVLGKEATVALGDYVAGPSHALPTGGTARFSSPLNVCDFIKFISVIDVNKLDVSMLSQAASIIARAEGLDAHARALEMRIRRK